MKTKVISAILAGACAISALSVSATAATSTKVATEQTVDGIQTISYSTGAGVISPTLNVVLPTNDVIKAYLNPYGLTTTSDGTAISGGIASPVYKVRNLGSESGVKLTVTQAKITPAEDQNITISTSEDGVATDATNKKIYAYISGKVASKQLQYDKSYKYETPSEDNVFTMGSEKKAVFTEAGTNNDILMTLAKATGTTSNKGVFTPTAYSYGEFQVTGVISSANPEIWGEEDTVTLDVAYKITPWNE